MRRHVYLPYPVRIAKAEVATEDKHAQDLPEFEFINQSRKARTSTITPGQFAELSVSGYGEIPIGIASSPTEGNDLLFTVNKVGQRDHPAAQHERGRHHGCAGSVGQQLPPGGDGGQEHRDRGRRLRGDHPALHHDLAAGPGQPAPSTATSPSSTARAPPACCSMKTSGSPGGKARQANARSASPSTVRGRGLGRPGGLWRAHRSSRCAPSRTTRWPLSAARR